MARVVTKDPNTCFNTFPGQSCLSLALGFRLCPCTAQGPEWSYRKVQAWL